MLSVLNRNSAALLALFIFVMGNGFFSTFITTVLTKHSIPSFTIGMMSSCFYAGVMLGSFRIERLIARVSHIRAYAFFASILAIIALLHGFFDDVYLWLLFRFIGGIVTAGVFIVVESWLLTQSTPTTRGKILALYMITFYASQSLGQLFLGLYNDNALLMFALISISSSLSVIPVAITRAEAPQYNEPSTLSLPTLFTQCASGLSACFASGLILGATYSLLPVYLIHQYNAHNTVAQLMFIVIFGGMLLQYPVGKLSDKIERRIVLLGTSLLSIVIIVLMFFTSSYLAAFALLCCFFGGFTFTLYPVSISYACDSLASEDIVAGTQTLLLVYSLGAMTGPLIAPLFMKSMNQWGLFSYYLVVLSLLTVFLSWRKITKVGAPPEEAFVNAIPQNTPIGLEVDPRGEDSIDTKLQ